MKEGGYRNFVRYMKCTVLQRQKKMEQGFTRVSQPMLLT